MKIFIISSIFFLSTLPLLSQSKKDIAVQKGIEAVKLMDCGKVEESITLLKEAQKLDPANIVYPYEIAYAHCLEENYEEAINILKPIQENEDASDTFFQMLGICYNSIGNNEGAIKTFEEGIKKFPDSGALYFELGNAYMAQDEKYTALSYFEKGIAADPKYPSNYYWAAKIYLDTEDEVWGMLYGELFMNLERNTHRTVEMSKLLYETYKSEITIVSDSAVSVSFCKYAGLDLKNNSESSFGSGIYEPILMLSLPDVKTLDLATLSTIRTNFLNIYYKNNIENIYPNVLLDYQKLLMDAGHLEAYNYWILMQGDPSEFLQWKSANESKWKSFTDWFSNNPIKLSSKNKFVKDQY